MATCLLYVAYTANVFRLSGQVFEIPPPEETPLTRCYVADEMQRLYHLEVTFDETQNVEVENNELPQFQLVTLSHEYVLTASLDRTAKIWDVNTGVATTTLQGHTGGVMSAVFSADETRVLTASWDNTAKIWDVNTGVATTTLQGHTGMVTSVTLTFHTKTYNKLIQYQ